MKKIFYYIPCQSFIINESGEKETVDELCGVELPWSAANEEKAKAEAHNGKPEIFDDGQPDPEPTTDDVLNALLGVTE